MTEIPGTVYHATHRENYKPITDSGVIKPSDGGQNNPGVGVYVAPTIDDSITWAEYFGEHYIGIQDDFVIFEINADDVPDDAEYLPDRNAGSAGREDEPRVAYYIQTDDPVPTTGLVAASEQALRFMNQYEKRGINPGSIRVFELEALPGGDVYDPTREGG